MARAHQRLIKRAYGHWLKGEDTNWVFDILNNPSPYICDNLTCMATGEEHSASRELRRIVSNLIGDHTDVQGFLGIPLKGTHSEQARHPDAMAYRRRIWKALAGIYDVTLVGLEGVEPAECVEAV